MTRQRTLQSLFGMLTAVVLWLPATVAAQARPPAVQLETYTGKPTCTFGFSGTGFVPGEQVAMVPASAGSRY